MFSRKTAQRTCRSPPSAPLLFVQLRLRAAGWQTKGDPPAQTAPRRILMFCQTAALFPRGEPLISAAPRALRFPRSASGRPSPQTPCMPPQSPKRTAASTIVILFFLPFLFYPLFLCDAVFYERYRAMLRTLTRLPAPADSTRPSAIIAYTVDLVTPMMRAASDLSTLSPYFATSASSAVFFRS